VLTGRRQHLGGVRCIGGGRELWPLQPEGAAAAARGAAQFLCWLYAGGKDIVHLTEAPEEEYRPARAAGTLDHVAFTCSDVESFRRRLMSHRIPFTSEVVPLTGELQIFLTDPAGNGIELNFAGGHRATV
jgi:hypothetical protein